MNVESNDIRQWVLSQLEHLTDCPNILVRDPLDLLPEADGFLGRFAIEHGYQPVVAATNLAFREVYEKVMADPQTTKMMVIDLAPTRRRSHPSTSKAPPPFYPDFLAKTPPEARLDLDLQQYLMEVTGDPLWPAETNTPRYARLITRHLTRVIRAHRNLRSAHPGRFSDHDFKTIVAFAALGIPESAFKRLDAEDYWKIGLLGHGVLEELSSLSPEVTQPIKEQLRSAPAPFRWFVDHDPEMVVRAFYLAVILAQHVEHWQLLPANIDPSLARFSDVDTEILRDSASKLISLDRQQAERDLCDVEESLNCEALTLLLFDQLQISDMTGCAAVIEREGYSILIRSLALLLALADLLSAHPNRDAHARIGQTLFPEGCSDQDKFVDSRPSTTWSQLREAYRLAGEIRGLRKELAQTLKMLQVLPEEKRTFELYREAWNDRKINRLEYYISALERLIHSGDLLPRAEGDLPAELSNRLADIRQRVGAIGAEVQQQLDRLNTRFQELVARQYSDWVSGTTQVHLTGQFIKRCLKPHWDPQREKAVLLIFDGMRYDIWDEQLRPMLMDRLELIADLPASSLLPSETHITRKAICAGGYPDQFNTRAGEDRLLKDALVREFHWKDDVDVVPPAGMGTGETVHYRTRNLDVHIFELCDQELHKINTKTLPDGRSVPARPLSFVYEQHIKNIIDTEVMAIIRTLAPGTKVFVTADHGFVAVPRNKLWLERDWLNTANDCSYFHASLAQSLRDLRAPRKIRDNVWEFAVNELRMPSVDASSGMKYVSVIFPKTGYALSRPDSHFNPPAYTHGGISIQELLIPMVVLKVKPRDEGLLTLEPITGPADALEGEELEFRMRISPTISSNTDHSAWAGELRAEVEGHYSRDPDRFRLPSQILYVPPQGTDVVYRFIPDSGDAADEERRAGEMERTLTLTVTYRMGRRSVRKSQTHHIVVLLNKDEIVRRVGNLGNLLGLTPKGMK